MHQGHRAFIVSSDGAHSREHLDANVVIKRYNATSSVNVHARRSSACACFCRSRGRL